MLVRAPSISAASLVKIAATGDAAPGGGVFAGPGFLAWPAAGGEGWVAFRTRIEGASYGEALVAVHMTGPAMRRQVARLGQTTACGGRFKSFIGRPAVNGSGDVAFLALLTAEESNDAAGPAPAGVFLFHQARPNDPPAAVACSGESTGAGAIDLAASVDPLADPAAMDAPTRVPALNDAGTVAVLSALAGAGAAPAAILVRPGGGPLTTALRVGDPFEAGTFTRLGPPALNAAGTLAFRGTVSGPAAGEGIFTLGAGGVTRHVVAGQTVDLAFAPPIGISRQTLTEFGDALQLGDDETIAFTAGPLSDRSRDATSPQVGPGALVFRAGEIRPIAYPGQELGLQRDRVKGIALGPTGSFLPAPPALAGDGSVVVFVTLNGGSAEALLRAEAPDYADPVRLLTTGGTGADLAPSGGLYAGLESGPAVDATGGLAFRARMTGGGASEGIVYRSAGAAATGVFVGEGAPVDGYFAGAPFSTPRLDGAGRVVFRAWVARGPANIGIFRGTPDGVESLVRAGDPAPPDGDPFLDFPGEPAVNAGGSVVFTADVAGRGRGVYALGERQIVRVVEVGDTAPLPTGGTFRQFGANPSINDAQQLSFRATVRYRNPATGSDENLEGVFLATASGLSLVASAGQPSPVHVPFAALRDPLVTGVPSLVFIASLGSTLTGGLFAADGDGLHALALEGQPLADGTTIAGLSANPAADAAGNVAFLATRAVQGRDLGAALMRRTGAGLDVILAKGMPGPAGGTVKSVGPAAMNGAGTLAFRTSFEPGAAEGAGFLLARGSSLERLVAAGDPTPLGGQLASFGARAALGDDDLLAFIGNLTGASARSALLLASPARLTVPALRLRRAPGARIGRLAMTLVFAPGAVHNGIDPQRESLRIVVGDTAGALWSGTIAAGALAPRGPALVLDDRTKVRGLRAVRLRQVGDLVRIRLVSSRAGIIPGGGRLLAPPFNVTVAIGDDRAVARPACSVTPRGARCAGPR